MLIIGVDKLYESAPPRKTKHGTFPVVDNCIEYKSFGNEINGTILLESAE